MVSPAFTSQQSWRSVRLNRNGPPFTIVDRREVPEKVITGTHLEGRVRSYHSTFYVSLKTTLGMLFEWKRGLEKRTPEEHLDAWRRLNPKEEGFAMVMRTSAFSLLY